jgi:hypothetical protein
MGTAWAHDGQGSMSTTATGPSTSPQRSTRATPAKRTRSKAPKPFVSADYKSDPDEYDGVLRVVIITSGSVASVKLPLIVGELIKVCMHPSFVSTFV